MKVKRRTKSVNIILSIFDQSNEALSVVDLVNRLKDDMNKTTVYRVLERLEADGVLHSFSGSNNLTWYAKCNSCSSEHHHDIHPHFECKQCGKVECLDLDIPIPVIKNRTVSETSIIISGQCEDCMSP